MVQSSLPSETTAAAVLPLTQVGPRQRVRVAVINGGCGAFQRLAELGLLIGSEVEVVRPSAGGPMVVQLRGSRLALGHGLAGRILVCCGGDGERPVWVDPPAGRGEACPGRRP